MDQSVNQGGLQSPPSLKKRKILIADDDQLLLGTYAAVFHEKGFDVEAVQGAEDALKCLEEGTAPPDIVFTGIKMGVMGGFELIEKMRADPRFAKIPVAISSHRGLQEDKARADALGVVDFIIQGFTTPREVVRRLELALGVDLKFKIAVHSERFSAHQLIEVLNKIQSSSCKLIPGEEILLELEATPEPGKFLIRIIC
jgi:CheY-like chemotaxis protein